MKHDSPESDGRSAGSSIIIAVAVIGILFSAYWVKTLKHDINAEASAQAVHQVEIGDAEVIAR